MIQRRKSPCSRLRRGRKVILEVTPRQLATILAALRGYQDENAPDKPDRPGADPALNDIATNGGRHRPLTKGQIDRLCQRLNCGPHAALAIYPSPSAQEHTEYTVVFQIDEYATNTRQAAWKAWETIKESDGPIFQVIDHSGVVVDEDLEVHQEGDPGGDNEEG